MIALLILILFVILGCRHVDPQTIAAARTLGMRRWSILCHVILPQARRYILAGVLLALAMACVEGWLLYQYGAVLLEYARGSHS